MKKIIIITTIFLLLLAFTSCELIGEYTQKAKKNATENIIENLIGDDAEVEITYPTPSSSNSQEPETTDNTENDTDIINWPEDIPRNVPTLELVIENKMKTPNGIILDFGEVSIDEVQKYINELLTNQFEIIEEDITEKYIDSVYQKDATIIKIYWYIDGSFTLMITWD